MSSLVFSVCFNLLKIVTETFGRKLKTEHNDIFNGKWLIILKFQIFFWEADTSGWECWKSRSVLTALFAVSLRKKKKKSHKVRLWNEHNVRENVYNCYWSFQWWYLWLWEYLQNFLAWGTKYTGGNILGLRTTKWLYKKGVLHSLWWWSQCCLTFYSFTF